MVFVVQLLIVLAIAAFRIFWLLGKHLRVSKQSDNPSHLEMTSYHKGRLNQCFFGVTLGYGFPFVVRRERWYHRIFKFSGIATEVQMGEGAVDDRWFFITDYPDHLERALRSENFRAALKAVLALPVTKVVSTPTRLWCKFDCRKLKKDTIERTKYWKLIEELQTQAHRLIPRTRLGYKLRIEAFIFLALHSALFWFSLVGLLPTLLDHNEIISVQEWLVVGGISAVLALAIWFAAIVFFFHGTSWAGWVFADFLLVGVIGVGVSAGYFARDVNIMADFGTPNVIERRLTERICEVKCKKSCGKNCTRRRSYTIHPNSCTPQKRAITLEAHRNKDNICYNDAWYEFTLEMPHWRADATDNYSYKSSSRVYDSTASRKIMRVPLREGALGMQWVDTDTIEAH